MRTPWLPWSRRRRERADGLVNLVMLAAAIPFALVVIAVAVLATVRYGISEDRVSVSMLGLKVREIPIRDIVSVACLPPAPGRPRGILRQGGMVEIGLSGGRSAVISPRDAEGFAEALKEAVSRVSGRAE